MNVALFNRARPSTAAEPAQLTDFEDFAAAQVRRRELRDRRTRLEAELRDAQRVLLEGVPDEDGVQAAALALVEGQPFNPSPSSVAEVERLRREIEVTRRAEAIAKTRYDEVRSRRSLEICQALRPRHERMAETIGSLLAALERACAEEAGFLDELRATGLELSPHLLPEMGFIPATPAHPGGASQAATWFFRAQQLGYFAGVTCLSDLRGAGRV